MMHDGAKVYVLDDDESFVRSARRLLDSWGFEAEGFTSPGAFLERSLDRSPACALVDARMPGVSGLEVQRALAVRERKLPVVFVSGHADVSAGVEAMKAGAIDFLPKPVDEVRLLDAVRRALAADATAEAARRRALQARAKVELLSTSELRICDLAVSGLRDDEIGEALGWSAGAVRSVRLRAMQALSATSLVTMVRALEAAVDGA